MNKMIGLIIAITVSIIIFVSVLAPTIYTATTDPDGEGEETAPITDPTWVTLIAVCGTLTIIAILMMVVRALGNKA